MIIPEEVRKLAKRLAKLNGLDLETAEEAVWVVGDCRELDGEGRVVVRLEDGGVLALVWPA